MKSPVKIRKNLRNLFLATLVAIGPTVISYIYPRFNPPTYRARIDVDGDGRPDEIVTRLGGSPILTLSKSGDRIKGGYTGRNLTDGFDVYTLNTGENCVVIHQGPDYFAAFVWPNNRLPYGCPSTTPDMPTPDMPPLPTKRFFKEYHS